jgi:hypothetical protein
VTRTTTSDASEGLTTCADLVATLKAPKASPTSPTLESETTLEAFLPRRSRWLAAGATASTHLHPVILVPKSANINRDVAAGLRWLLIIMAHISGVANRAGNNPFRGGQRRPRSQLSALMSSSLKIHFVIHSAVPSMVNALPPSCCTSLVIGQHTVH